jgi:hypothetical protein
MPPLGLISAAMVSTVLSQPMTVRGIGKWDVKTNDVFAEATLQVSHPAREITLTLKVTCNLERLNKYTFNLMLNGKPIRRFEACGSHKNTHTDHNKWLRAPHEHVWTDECHGDWARDAKHYPANFNDAFIRFCKSLGIKSTVTWNDPPPRQKSLDEI